MFYALDLIDGGNPLHVHYYGIINKLTMRKTDDCTLRAAVVLLTCNDEHFYKTRK